MQISKMYSFLAFWLGSKCTFMSSGHINMNTVLWIIANKIKKIHCKMPFVLSCKYETAKPKKLHIFITRWKQALSSYCRTKLALVQSLTFHYLCSILIFLVLEFIIKKATLWIFSLTQSNETSDGCTCPSAALAFQKIRYTQEGKQSLPRGFHVSHVFFHRTPPLSAGRAAQAAECFLL